MELKTMIKRWKLTDRVLTMEVLDQPFSMSLASGKARVFAQTDDLLFCYVDGYQETVFACEASNRSGLRMTPIAYNTEDFVRLLYTVGSADLAGRCGFMTEEELARRKSRITRIPEGIERLFFYLHLHPIENPHRYVQTIQGLLDTSLLIPVQTAAAS